MSVRTHPGINYSLRVNGEGVYLVDVFCGTGIVRVAGVIHRGERQTSVGTGMSPGNGEFLCANLRGGIKNRRCRLKKRETGFLPLYIS